METSHAGPIPSRSFFARFLSRPNGFTLIELIVVLFIIGLIAMLTLPVMIGSLSYLSVDASAKDIAAGLRSARALAIAHKGVSTFYFYPDRNAFWIVEGYQRISVGAGDDEDTIYAEEIELSSKKKDVEDSEIDLEEVPEEDTESDEPSKNLIQELRLVSSDVSVSFEERFPMPDLEQMGEPLFRVVFFPKGNSTGGAFIVADMEDPDSYKSYKIEIESLTGRITLREYEEGEPQPQVI